MKDITKIFSILLIVLAGSFYSCEEQRITFDGPSQVGFVGEETTFYLLRDITNSMTVKVQLIGAQQAEPVTLTLSIDTDNTTARENIDYLPFSNTVTIPANSSLGELTIESILDMDELPLGEIRTLALKVQSVNGVDIIAENFAAFDVSIAQKPVFAQDDWVGTYTMVDGYELAGNWTYSVSMAVDPTNEDAMLLTNLWTGGETIQMLFDDDDFTVDIPRQYFDDGSWDVYGPWDCEGYGTFNVLNKTVSITYNAIQQNGPTVWLYGGTMTKN